MQLFVPITGLYASNCALQVCNQIQHYCWYVHSNETYKVLMYGNKYFEWSQNDQTTHQRCLGATPTFSPGMSQVVIYSCVGKRPINLFDN